MNRNVVLVVSSLAFTLTVALIAGCNESPPPTDGGVTTTQPITPGTVPYRGVAIQLASGCHKPIETYGPMIDEIVELGANTVLLCVPGQMEHAQSQSIYIDVRKAPPPADLEALIQHSRQRGVKVILMPIVLLRNPRGSEWRGVIDPPDWDEWWRQYEEFVLFFADIGSAGGADGLIVGSELVSTEKYKKRWEKLIAKVRPRFAGGKLGYSANWDHYRPVEFWDKLDFIGMTSYYTLADKANPTVEQIIRKWEPIKADILAWQRRVGKPILLTEVGWCSQEGAARSPWNYYQNQKATAAGHEEQRRLYEAFVRVWSNTPQLMGVIWWEWKAGDGGNKDYGYTPKNKPAERVLRKWLKPAAPTTTSAPTR